MTEPGLHLSMKAERAGAMIEQFLATGHTIRALVELRTLLDETQFWDDPERQSPVRDIYTRSVAKFAEFGVTESELKITLYA